MTQQSADERPLPVQRAFVVQLHAAAAVTQGQATHFYTLDELLAFMARALAALDSTVSGRPRPRRT